MNSKELLPSDKNVIHGKLKNGVTYYLRHNATPKGKVEMRLAVNVGSVVEEEDERGLAHFTEHLAFKGTDNFPDTEIVKQLADLGVEFGSDLNAYTGFDKTVYIIPIASEHMEKGMQILSDWAFGIQMTEESVQSERSVIMEEMRTSQGADERLRNKWFPVVFRGSKYAQRMPIGLADVVENTPAAKIKEFYKKWYRPDTVSVIVVGDVNTDEALDMVKKYFSNEKKVEKPHKRFLEKIPFNDAVRVMVMTDPESQYDVIRIVHKMPKLDLHTVDDFKKYLLCRLHTVLLSARLKELSQGSSPYFLYASATYNRIVHTTDGFVVFVVCEKGKVKSGYKKLFSLLRSLKKLGFLPSEFERGKAAFLNTLATKYSEKNKTESKEYANEYIMHFTDEFPFPGIEYEYEFVKKYFKTLTLEQMNTMLQSLIIKDWTVMVAGNENNKDDFPTEDELLLELKSLPNIPVKQWVDKEVQRDTLVEKLPKNGIVKSISDVKNTQVKVVEFESGVRVILMPNAHKADEIVFSAIRKGGYSTHNDYISSFFSTKAAEESGVGELSKVELMKYLADKTTYVCMSISSYQDSLSGYSSMKDIKTFFEMIYLRFTNHKIDQDVFDTVVRNDCKITASALDDPQEYFSDCIKTIMSCSDPRGDQFTPPSELEKANYDSALDILKANFSHGEDFTFVFVGSFTVDEILPYLEQYIAPLGKKRAKSEYKDMGIRPPVGRFEKTVYKGLDEKSITALIFDTPKEYTVERATAFAALGEVLKISLTRRLRQDMGAVYGVGVNANYIRVPYQHSNLTITIPCSPENVDVLASVVLDEIKKIQTEGPQQEIVQKVKATRDERLKGSLQTNRFCMMQLLRFDFFNDPLERLSTLKD
ncbi:MAG: insulinase family protein, partial [Flavobacteriales bacterium]|nr:insulinase family protein [Flavobacteriales bacterium]